MIYINLQRNICFLFSETSPHPALNISTSEQFIAYIKFPISWAKLTPYIGCPKLSRTNKRFYNSNFRDLLIMQFNKLLITLSK